MRKQRADEIYGQGLIISVAIGLLSALLIFAFRDVYFRVSGIEGEILENALQYYRFLPINAFLTIVVFFLEQMVYSDGDELCNNICYGFQIGGNVLLSIILTKHLGMTGIILGSVIGNGLGILVCLWHFFRKENTLHFVWHLSFRDFLMTSRYSIVNSCVYICWGLMDYVMIGFVSARYGQSGLITLAVVVSLIEFGVVMDGVGTALQPLIGTYFGEKNHALIRRVMRSGVKAAILEGVAATALIWIFSKQFCALFGITGGDALAPSISAIRIVSLGFVFCSMVSLTTSYYMLIDRIGLATCFACFQNGLLYILLPFLGGRPVRAERNVDRVCAVSDPDFDRDPSLRVSAIREGEFPLPAEGYEIGDRGAGRYPFSRSRSGSVGSGQKQPSVASVRKNRGKQCGALC